MKVRVYMLDGQVVDVNDVDTWFLVTTDDPSVPVEAATTPTLVLIAKNILGFRTTPST